MWNHWTDLYLMFDWILSQGNSLTYQRTVDVTKELATALFTTLMEPAKHVNMDSDR